MKMLFPLIALLLLGSLAAETPTFVVAKPRPTRTDLAARASHAQDLYRPNSYSTRSVKPVSSADREDPTRRSSLRTRSAVLSFGEFWTMVPKGAVLHIPSSLASRVNVEPQGTLISWSDFMARNRGWLRVHPVEMAQARGESPVSEESLEAINNSSQVVIATFQNGPISVSSKSLSKR